MKKEENVNLFFACDDNYLPLLAVTLTSIKEHAANNRKYVITVLNTGLREEYKERILRELSEDRFDIFFRDITEELIKIADKLHTRDYYSCTTYYRLFIPRLYPELKKALYLDCDLVATTDVAKLYDTELSDNLVAGVPDGFVNTAPELRLYAKNRLGKFPESYFNAGVLLMNLEALRDFNFEKKFTELISCVKFTVAQDQDYLNLICRDRELILDAAWNCMPGFELTDKAPSIIHYNLHNKPWHKDGVHFEEVFDEYARKSCFIKEIRDIYAGYDKEKIQKAEKETAALLVLAANEACDTDTCRQIAVTAKDILCKT